MVGMMSTTNGWIVRMLTFIRLVGRNWLAISLKVQDLRNQQPLKKKSEKVEVEQRKEETKNEQQQQIIQACNPATEVQATYPRQHMHLRLALWLPLNQHHPSPPPL